MNVDNELSKRRLRILTTHNEEMAKEFDSLINSEAEYRSKFKDTNVG